MVKNISLDYEKHSVNVSDLPVINEKRTRCNLFSSFIN